jgi:hypothetical protein
MNHVMIYYNYLYCYLLFDLVQNYFAYNIINLAFMLKLNYDSLDAKT